jgi:hypothetical protein
MVYNALRDVTSFPTCFSFFFLPRPAGQAWTLLKQYAAGFIPLAYDHWASMQCETRIEAILSYLDILFVLVVRGCRGGCEGVHEVM